MTSAWAGGKAGAYGTSGYLQAPAHDLMAHGEMGVGLSFGTAIEPGFYRFDPLPIGVAVGIISRMEAYGQFILPMRNYERLDDRTFGILVGIRGRLALQEGIRPGLVLEGWGGTPNLIPEIGYALTFGFQRKGVRTSMSYGAAFRELEIQPRVAPLGSIGVEGRLHERLWLIGELSWKGDLGFEPLAFSHRFDARFGFRVLAHENLQFLPWVGFDAGSAGGALRLGAVLSFSTRDLHANDMDDDRMPDDLDLCPYQPEDKDGFQDDDGCIDADNDGDGIPDAEDQTPDGEGTEEIIEGSAARFPIFGPPPAPQQSAVPTLEELKERQRTYFEKKKSEGNGQGDDESSDDATPN